MARNFILPIQAKDARLLAFQEVTDSLDLPRRIQQAPLPYFALGFTAVSTPAQHNGSDLVCGFQALAKSYNAAGLALKLPNFKKTSIDELQTMFETIEYQDQATKMAIDTN